MCPPGIHSNARWPQRSATSTTGIPILGPSRASRSIDSSGAINAGVGPTTISSGRPDPYRDDFSILVAGCGTSQAARHAMRWPAAQVTAIDVSATSVRCTEELRRTHGLTNLEVQQLPIDRVHELGRLLRSDRLHRGAASSRGPRRGLAALREVLETGRRHASDGLCAVRPHRHLHAAGVLQATRHPRDRRRDSRPHRRALRDLPRGHPLERLLRTAPDFRQEPALADALLHPQDRAYWCRNCSTSSRARA